MEITQDYLILAKSPHFSDMGIEQHKNFALKLNVSNTLEQLNIT